MEKFITVIVVGKKTVLTSQPKILGPNHATLDRNRFKINQTCFPFRDPTEKMVSKAKPEYYSTVFCYQFCLE